MYQDTILTEGLKELQIPYTDEMLSKLHRYYEMMVAKNQVMNLTSITEYEEVVVKHWLDSLCFAKVYNRKRKEGVSPRLIDIGTGAGFPGIPIKIFFPEIEVVLLDSLQKRITFLQDVVNELELHTISCIHGRAEELSGKALYRETFDYAVSRAVARLVSLSEFCIPFVKQGGEFVSYKSESTEEEIAESLYAMKTFGCSNPEILQYTVPGSDLPRRLVIAKKVSSTPGKFPRGGGKPLKAPLLKPDKA